MNAVFFGMKRCFLVFQLVGWVGGPLYNTHELSMMFVRAPVPVIRVVEPLSLARKYPQYCWEFHDWLGEALSGTISEKRGVPQPSWGGETSGNALEASNALN